MERRELEYFLAIAEHGSFTAAAQALHVAQPSLSHAIRNLEHELGGKVFHRLPHGVALTAAGEALVEPARQVMRDLSTASASVRRVLGLSAGRLDVVAQTTLAVDPLAELIGAFLRAHPKVAVTVSDPELGADVTGTVRAGECELGMVDTEQSIDDLANVVLRGREILAVLPPGSAPERKTLSRSELSTLDWVTTPRGTATRAVIEDMVGANGPAVAVETTHHAMVVPLVLAGAGATLLPQLMARDAAARGAVVLPLRPRVIRRGVLFWRPGPLSPAAAEFVRMVGASAEPRRR
ncbi:LysR family transcriptional regulator [Saccharopolyspora phatthalungensis]|uniref:DNA-binding transcriptional LysR family regulator n=1 Tax=Saccharopolyspora phatthalungensis TaxID=664693 RepID=A0A840Q892_9PSEU|nr:LysR family transcriptional regulator [Saccharopolyspora phatthalungensis]MBB5153003.1 DNA-binding transcriptional LysR family regulator [Saccharopolyspora phatthalungensis]